MNQKQAHGEKTPSATKRGPGRFHRNGHTTKVERVKEAGGYGKGLTAARTRDQRLAIELRAKAVKFIRTELRG